MEKIALKQVLVDQQEEFTKAFKGVVVKREVEQKFEQMLSDDLIKVITGARRCGKSFLARKILSDKNCGYVNFDDERLAGVKTENLNDLLEVLKEIKTDIKYLFFDEIQNIAGWELYVNRLKRSDYNIIITGSNSKLLSKELATHLTGRHVSLELFPFSFAEYLSYRGLKFADQDFYSTEKKALIKQELDKYMKTGGFPETLKVEFREQYLSDLYNQIVSRDIIARHQVRQPQILKELALYVFSNFGSKITYHKLKNIFDIKSVNTIKSYLKYLEESYLIFQLSAFSFKTKEIIRGARKIYCIDNGMASALSLSTFDNVGRLMENVVFLELKRRGCEIYFYVETGTNYEVDFVVKQKTAVKELIQVCFNLDDYDTKNREIKALIRAKKHLRCNNLLIITWDKEGEEIIDDNNIKYIPLYKWLLDK